MFSEAACQLCRAECVLLASFPGHFRAGWKVSCSTLVQLLAAHLTAAPVILCCFVVFYLVSAGSGGGDSPIISECEVLYTPKVMTEERKFPPT